MFNNEPLRAFFYRTRREPGSGAFQWCAARGVVSLGLRARVRVRAKSGIDLNSLAKPLSSVLCLSISKANRLELHDTWIMIFANSTWIKKLTWLEFRIFLFPSHYHMIFESFKFVNGSLEFMLISSNILCCPLKCCGYEDTETVPYCKETQPYLQTPIKRHQSTSKSAYSLISIIL